MSRRYRSPDEWGPIVRAQQENISRQAETDRISRQQQRDSYRAHLQYQIQEKEKTQKESGQFLADVDRSMAQQRMHEYNQYQVHSRQLSNERKKTLADSYKIQTSLRQSQKFHNRTNDVDTESNRLMQVQETLKDEAKLLENRKQNQIQTQRAVIDLSEKKKELERQFAMNEKLVDRQRMVEHGDKIFDNINKYREQLSYKLNRNDARSRNHAQIINEIDSRKQMDEHLLQSTREQEVTQRNLQKEIIESELRFANQRSVSQTLRSQIQQKEDARRISLENKRAQEAMERQTFSTREQTAQTFAIEKRMQLDRYRQGLIQQINDKQNDNLQIGKLTENERKINQPYLNQSFDHERPALGRRSKSGLSTDLTRHRIPPAELYRMSKQKTSERLNQSEERRAHSTFDYHNPIVNPLGARVPMPGEKPLYKPRHDFALQPLTKHLRGNDFDTNYYCYDF